MGVRPGTVVNCGLESAISFAQQHRNAAISKGEGSNVSLASIRHGEVRFSIAIEIAHCDEKRIGAGTVLHRAQELAIAFAKQDRDAV